MKLRTQLLKTMSEPGTLEDFAFAVSNFELYCEAMRRTADALEALRKLRTAVNVMNDGAPSEAASAISTVELAVEVFQATVE